MSRLITAILVGMLVFVFSIEPHVTQNSSSPVQVTLSDLNFMIGLWQADWSGGLGEEQWGRPSGDSMVGTFRFVKDGKAQFYEFMLIEQTTRGPALKLKHFNAGLIGWEEKAEVYSFPLIECRANNAIFEREDKKSRLTYSRTSREALQVVLEEPSDGRLHSEIFRFRLLR